MTNRWYSNRARAYSSGLFINVSRNMHPYYARYLRGDHVYRATYNHACYLTRRHYHNYVAIMQRDYACHRNELKTGVAFSKKIHGPCPCKTVISALSDYVISHDFDNGDVISSSHNMSKHTLKIIL